MPITTTTLEQYDALSGSAALPSQGSGGLRAQETLRALRLEIGRIPRCSNSFQLLTLVNDAEADEEHARHALAKAIVLIDKGEPQKARSLMKHALTYLLDEDYDATRAQIDAEAREMEAPF